MKFVALILLASILLFGCTGTPPQASPSVNIVASVQPSGVLASSVSASTIIPSNAPSPISGLSKFVPYDKEQYENALLSGKIILMFFQSSACPDCEIQKAVIEGTFKSMALSNVAGFNVKFIPPQANPDEEAIAKIFSVNSSGTILVLGESAVEKYKDSRSLSSEEIVLELEKAGAR